MTNTIFLASAKSDCLQSCLSGGGGASCNDVCASAPSVDGTSKIVNPALGSLSNQSGISFFQNLLPKIITIGLIAGVLIFFFTLVVGAIQWISSGGDKQALEGAKGKITNALVGLVILFSAFAIIKLIEMFFGVSILTLDIGKLVIQ